jgi:Mor family transcriptional regulator
VAGETKRKEPVADVVDDALAKVVEALGEDVFTPAMAAKIEADIRRSWAGSVYVLSKPASKAKQLLVDWRNGDDVATVACRYGMSERRARQIINQRKKYKDT